MPHIPLILKENNVLKNLFSLKYMDDFKTIDKVIAYNRDMSDVMCSNINDIKSDVINPDNTVNTKCLKFIKFLGDPTDHFKDECPMGSTPLLSQNMCVGSQYDAICPPGLDKIGNSCYKPCNNDFVTVDIKTVDNYVQSNNGSKCIANSIPRS